MLQDSEARKQAISPHDSFIVQAPAGSGKTELLTQRFLKLLTIVDAPEQIFALTFTRKAANEMRGRILSTLEACQKEQVQSSRPETFLLAQTVLARDKALNWEILRYPNRLRVMTIDALCQLLVTAIPLQKEKSSGTEIEALPARLYERAVWACFQHALEDNTLQPALLALLAHLDNRQDRLLALWVELLKSRDQWLPILFKAQAQTKMQVEEGLKHIETRAVERLLKSIPNVYQEALRGFCVQLGSVLGEYAVFKNWRKFDALTREQAQLLAKLLLTTQKTVRKKIDHHIKFTRECCEPLLYQSLKAEGEALFEQLAFAEEFVKALTDMFYLPETAYEEGQWSILSALFTLLPVLAAHLKLVFQEALKMDFIEVASLALTALGDEDSPTDLALYLDYRIQHLLIDEFQDTSYTQFHLLTRMISGWQAGDGRTMFIVGDPMQSIYRFRQAEVGLFLKVQAEGMGELSLTPLSLSCNFRSSSQLVAWMNQAMSCIFPKQDDMESGSVQFHAAVPVRPEDANAEVHGVLLEDKHQEALYIAEKVEKLLTAFPEDSIAILVRSRSQLEMIIPVLQKQGIDFEGVDLFSLSSVSHLRDIYNLTQALLMPAERLPWFSVLRSPYVGLSLPDLHAVALLTRSSSIYSNLDFLSQSESLSLVGRERLAFASLVFTRMFELKFQYTLSEWILHTHQQLHGEAWCGPDEIQDLEQFFDLIDHVSEHHTLSDWRAFETYCKALFVKQSKPARLKIMTIHQAKGLEFDTVILPSLGAKTRRSEQPLLRSLSLVQAHGDKWWLISPLKASHEETSAIYEYLTRLDAEKDKYEQLRVLYVALTRAKRRLYLLDYHATPAKESFRSTLSQLTFEPFVSTVTTLSNKIKEAGFYRVPLKTYLKQILPLCPEGHEVMILSTDNRARVLGVIAHRWLQWVCERKINHVSAMPWLAIERNCLEAGFVNQEKDWAINALQTQFQRLFNSEIGQWIIASHTDEQNEYALLVSENNAVKTYIVDRTFYEQGCRWIIDFKTGLDDEAAIAKHHMQVERYAWCFRQNSPDPIYCGLYYLATGKWVKWISTHSNLVFG